MDLTVTVSNSPKSQALNEITAKSGDDEAVRMQLLQQLKTPQQLKNKRGHRKRRHSVAEDHSSNESSKPSAKHHRQYSSHNKKGYAGDIILPTNFLLGGNISDPLNLKSLMDENVNNVLNAITPSSSPLPPRSSNINIIIPNDMTDPLGLNQSDILNNQHNNISTNRSLIGRANSKKRKKRRKSQFEKVKGQFKVKTSQATNESFIAQKEAKPTKNRKSTSKLLNIESDTPPSNSMLSIALPKIPSAIVDPIVSPAVPQDVSKSSAVFSPKSRKRKSASQAKKIALVTENVDKSEDTIQQKKAKTDGDCSEFINEKLIAEIKTARLKATSSSKLNSQVSVPQHDQLKAHKLPNFKACNARFQYGNYTKYYGYRNSHKFQDSRMNFLKKEWFKDKDILDVGCNSGHFTLLIARDFSPRKIVGIDIDGGLIDCARKNVRHYATAQARTPTSKKYPDSLSILYGPIIAPPLESAKDDKVSFPNNVIFLQGNYVPEKNDVLQYQEPEYDVILCMSVTKWIHLNWGDEGLIKTFKRFYKQLRPGGKLILEPQEWKSYTKKKNKLTETIYKNFYSITLKPESFSQYLIDEIGFEKVEILKSSSDSRQGKGFQRPIQLYYKPE